MASREPKNSNGRTGTPGTTQSSWSGGAKEIYKPIKKKGGPLNGRSRKLDRRLSGGLGIRALRMEATEKNRRSMRKREGYSNTSKKLHYRKKYWYRTEKRRNIEG